MGGLSFILILRFGRKKGLRKIAAKRKLLKPILKKVSTQTISEFYVIEKALNELGLSRKPSESLKNWVERLKDEPSASHLIDDLKLLVELYYRSRFDPKGISETERASLKSSIKLWLDEFRKIS